MFANVVYILCAATSMACAFLLLRGYRQSRTRLLFWSAICFFALAVNNVMLLVDLRLVPSVDLSIWRLVPAVIGTGVLIFGLIWEVR